MTYRTTYDLTLERTSTDPTPVLKQFKRADSAHYAARQLAYELIKAEARLDTQVGHAFAHAVDAWEVSPPVKAMSRNGTPSRHGSHNMAHGS